MKIIIRSAGMKIVIMIDAEMTIVAVLEKRKKRMSTPTSGRRLLTTPSQMSMSMEMSFSGMDFNGFRKLNAS